MNRNKIPFLQIESYEHPWDKSARDALEQVPGFTGLTRKLNEIGFERLLRVQYTGSSLKVSQTNFPELHNALREACNILGICHQPDLYLQWNYNINGFTAGVEKPIIVLNSGCIDLLSPDELLFVIAHELGHIKSKHVLYYQTATYLPALVHYLGNFTLGIGGLLTSGLQLALQNWQRMSEFTADRAGLLACQDPNVAANAMVKMAGLPHKYYSAALVNEFIKQAKEFESYDYDALDKVVKVLSTMNRSHPWTVMRTAELFKWVEGGEYDKILNQQDWRSATKPGLLPSVKQQSREQQNTQQQNIQQQDVKSWHRR
jgi:Zn-dependent protease with chaperone function